MDTGKPPRGRRSTMATSRGGAGDDDERLHASSTVRAGELDFGVSGEGAETKARNSASSRTSIRGSGRGATLGSGGWLLRLGEAGRAIPERVCKITRSVCVCAYMCVPMCVLSRGRLRGNSIQGGGLMFRAPRRGSSLPERLANGAYVIGLCLCVRVCARGMSHFRRARGIVVSCFPFRRNHVIDLSVSEYIPGC